MTTWRTTVIMKTDIKGSTVRLRALPEADLDALLTEHRALVSRIAAAHDGRIVKPEGDGFWVVFPSVTAGAHQEGALIGDAVVLAARIEEITPPDAIYLSAVAQLAVNQAEVRTALVDAFTLKGFPAPVPVYRIEQTHRTRVIAEQYIVVTDLHGFATVTATAPITVVEKVLDSLLELVDRVCRECDGTSRFSAGDAYCLTFPDATRAMAAVEHLADAWGTFARREGLHCPINVVVHKGTLYAFRSYLWSDDLNVAFGVDRVTHRLPPGDTWIFVTGPVRQALVATPWNQRLQPVALESTAPQLAEVEVYRLR